MAETVEVPRKSVDAEGVTGSDDGVAGRARIADKVVHAQTGSATPPYVLRFYWWAFAAIFIIALGMRIPEIATRSLWIDELYSEWFASRPFFSLWTDVPLYEPHPPMYYTLLRAWTLLWGNSELALRSLSLIASLATVCAVALSGRIVMLGRSFELAGLLAAGLLALNYANIRDAQNARPYALQTLFCTIAIIAAFALVNRIRIATEKEHWREWLWPAVILGLSAGYSLWFHNTGLFICLGIWSGLLLTTVLLPSGRRGPAMAIYAASGLLALLVWSPFIPIFIRQSQAFMGLAFWLQARPRDLYSAWLLFFGENAATLALVLPLLLLGLYRLGRKTSAVNAGLSAAILLIPLYAMLAISFSVKPIYIQRLLAWMLPLGFLVICYGLASFARMRWLGYAMSAGLFAFSAYQSITDLERPIDDWKMISDTIARHARPGDVVIAMASEGSIAVDYYARRHPDFPPIVYIPGHYPLRNLPRTYISNLGAPIVIASDRAIVDKALREYRRVWLVPVSVALYDPKGYIRDRIALQRTFQRFYGNSLARVDLYQ